MSSNDSSREKVKVFFNPAKYMGPDGRGFGITVNGSTYFFDTAEVRHILDDLASQLASAGRSPSCQFCLPTREGDLEIVHEDAAEILRVLRMVASHSIILD